MYACVFSSFFCNSSVSLMSVFVLIIECIFLSFYCYTEYMHTYDDVQSFDFYCSKFVFFSFRCIVVVNFDFLVGIVLFSVRSLRSNCFQSWPTAIFVIDLNKTTKTIDVWWEYLLIFFIALSHEKANFSILFSYIKTLKVVL